MLAPRFWACSKLSTTRTPAPSPITKPLRSLSNGIDERSGSSVVESAVRALKPPIPILVIEASEPPAKTTSWNPNLISRKASPIASLAEAQAVVTDLHTPCAPILSAIFPAPIFERALGINIGWILFIPRSCIRII